MYCIVHCVPYFKRQPEGVVFIYSFEQIKKKSFSFINLDHRKLTGDSYFPPLLENPSVKLPSDYWQL